MIFNTNIPDHSKKFLKYFTRYQQMQCCSSDNCIPLGIADTELICPQEISEALQEYCKGSFFPYASTFEDVKIASAEFINKTFNAKVKPEWIVLSSGLLATIRAIMYRYNKGDYILTSSPMYSGILDCIEPLNKKLLDFKLTYQEYQGKTRLMPDFSVIPNLMNKSKVFIFCNPHNPGGTIFNEQEINNLAKLALVNNNLFIVDEIHSPFIYSDCHSKFYSAFKLQEELLENTVISFSFSKVFNLGGIPVAMSVVKNTELRNFIEKALNDITTMGMIAHQKSIECYPKYLPSILQYLEENRNLLINTLKECKNIKMPSHLESTFLLWLTSDNTNNLQKEFIKNDLFVYNGEFFNGTSKFIRLNFAIRRNILIEKVLPAIKTIDQNLN